MRRLMLFVLLAFSLTASAQQLEVLPLRYRTVDQVLPALRPLVEPGGALTGANNQLFLRASPRNRVDIKRALAALDQPQRRLVIRVRQNVDEEEAARGAAVSGSVTVGNARVSTGNGTEIGTHRHAEDDLNARVYDTRSQRGEQSGQAVQTIDGGRAFIQVGQSLALPMRRMVAGPGGTLVSEGIVYRDVGQGFYAEPHVNGEQVTVEISQQAESLVRSGPPGSVRGQYLSTTVAGRLGEWMRLGGADAQSDRRDGETAGLSTAQARSGRSIWLRVDEVD
jgi:type II secretory pathway component GspD/PulD (secretin)